MNEFIQPGPISIAYARRQYQESERSAPIFAHYTDSPVKLVDPEQREKEIMESALRVTKILRTGNNLTGKAIETAFWRKRLATIFNTTFQEEFSTSDDWDVEKMGRVAEAFASAAVRIIYPPFISFSVRAIPLICNSAVKLGQERDMKPEVLFSVDTLYAEVLRETFEEPGDFLRPTLQTAENFTSEAWIKIISSDYKGILLALRDVTPEELADTDVTSEDLERELLLDSNYLEVMNKFSSGYRLALQVVARDELDRFWGSGMGSLPEDVKALLLKDFN